MWPSAHACLCPASARSNLMVWGCGSIPDPSGDSYLHLPDASGTVVTTGSLPSVIDSMVVVGGARLEGKVRMHGDVTIGNKLEPSILEVHSPLAR